MSEEITTIAALKRALTPGRKLRLLRCVYPPIIGVDDGRVGRPAQAKEIEPSKQARTVKKVRSKDVIFLNHEGRYTYLTLNAGCRVEPTDGGFKLIDTDVTVEYVFEDER